MRKGSETETFTDAVILLANTLNKVNTTLDKLMELLSKTTTAAATTRTTAADNDVPADVCVERGQA